MVCLSESIPYEEIIKNLNKEKDRIALVCCNSCVRFCGTASVELMYETAEKLKKDGFKVVDTVPTTCLCIKDYLANATVSDDVTAVVVCACDAGVCSTEMKFKDSDVKIVETVKTLGLILGDRRNGRFKLMMPFEEYEDLAGKEWQMMSGKRLEDEQIDIHIEEGH